MRFLSLPFTFFATLVIEYLKTEKMDCISLHHLLSPYYQLFLNLVSQLLPSVWGACYSKADTGTPTEVWAANTVTATTTTVITEVTTTARRK